MTVDVSMWRGGGGGNYQKVLEAHVHFMVLGMAQESELTDTEAPWMEEEAFVPCSKTFRDQMIAELDLTAESEL